MLTEPKYRIGDFIQLSNLCQKISNIDKDKFPTTLRAFEAKKIFNKIMLHSLSFIKLWPQKNDEKSINNIDAGSLASIARNIIETHNVFQYICEKGISKDEHMFRMHLMSLHQSVDLTRILSAFGFSDLDGTIRVSDMGKCAGAFQLEDNTFYLTYSEQQQKEFLKGYNN